LNEALLPEKRKAQKGKMERRREQNLGMYRRAQPPKTDTPPETHTLTSNCTSDKLAES
jgi:hypothetical protein